MSKHRLSLSHTRPSSDSDYLDYSERGLPDSQEFEGDIFPSVFCERAAVSSKVPLLLTGCSPGGAEDLLAYAEHELPDSVEAYDPLPDLWLNSSPKKDKAKPTKARPMSPPPDISEGIGHNQAKKDLVALGSYIRDNKLWLVNERMLYQYDGRRWERMDKISGIRAIKEVFLECENIRCALSERDYRELYDQLLTDPVLYHPDRLAGPTDKLNCLDGVLDLSETPPRKIKHDPDDGFLFVLPLSCDDILNPPIDGHYFESFVESVSGGDPAVRQQLLELTILALTGLQLKCLYVILGPTNSGKTQWGRFLLELLGPENVGTVRDIDDFGEKWTVGTLAGKRLGLCMDLPDRPLSKAAIGILKQFCGADPIKAEVKYANSFTYYEKPLMLLAGNHPIRVPNADKEDAFLDRMITVPFTTSISKEEKVLDFYLKLLGEAPYIVHEAILAYQDLVDRNYELTRAEVPLAYRPQEGRSLYNVISDFVAQTLVEEPDTETTSAELYELFCAQGTHPEVSVEVFSRTLSQVLRRSMPAVMPVKRVSGTGMRGFKNLAVIPAVDL